MLLHVDYQIRIVVYVNMVLRTEELYAFCTILYMVIILWQKTSHRFLNWSSVSSTSLASLGLYCNICFKCLSFHILWNMIIQLPMLLSIYQSVTCSYKLWNVTWHFCGFLWKAGIHWTCIWCIIKRFSVVSVCWVHLLLRPSYVPHHVNNIHSIVSAIW
jgi:hypothetical protein